MKFLSVTSTLLTLYALVAHAQTYPSKPVRIIVPLSASSTGDALARMVGDNLTQKLGQSFVVETRPGASGQIGVAAVVRSPPDGYTIMLASTGPITINPVFYGAKLGFDPVKDLAAITQVANTESVLLVHPSLPVRNIKEFIAFAKARPGELVYSSAGNSSTTHLHLALFNSMAGIKMLHVPYKGSTEGLIAVASGETQAMLTGWINALPLAKSGKVRMLAVTSAQRNPAAPELPAIKESVPGYEADQWYGVLAPAATPKAIIALLHRTIATELQTSAARTWLAERGAVAVGSTPEQFGARIKSEIAKWGKIIQESGTSPE